MRFIDEAILEVKAGHGGRGAKRFRREKYVPFGGPDGGDGGRGGSVILIADHNSHTLLDFRFQPKWEAEDGGHGEGGNREGKAGQDLIIKVPVGTEIFREGTNEFICDLTQNEQQFILAKGGRGGKGNSFFKSATNQVPEHAQPGEEGEEGIFRFSLKLVADVGIVGFPNAGKSTLISRISSARPKIADYPFTTLTPNLGVVKGKGGKSFIVADIPGLIPGAHEGKGLGIQFLKHVERTRALLHLIDPNQIDDEGNPVAPQASFDIINHELTAFSAELAKRLQIIVLTKMDSVSDRTAVEEARAYFEAKGLKTFCISSASGEGLEQLTDELTRVLFQGAE